MKTLESLMVSGQLEIKKTNCAGEITVEMCVPNLVVSVGKAFIAASMVKTSNTPAAMTHMAIGSGTAPAIGANTSLEGQLGRVSITSAVATANSVTYRATFPAGTGTGAVTEAGIFNAAANGTMLCRTTFPIVTKQAGDSIEITWTVTIN